MDLLFEPVGVNAPDFAASRSARVPEVCPECGRMAEYVERFANGRFMASHGSERQRVKCSSTGEYLNLNWAKICHGGEGFNRG